MIVEREFTTASVHQGYIEPHNATAHWRADGQINLWTSTQGAFVVRANTADVLRVDVSDVRVTPMEIGGGFGGKVSFYLEPVAALLSRKSGAPVKILMSRTEVFEGSGPAPGSWMRVKMGANRAGKITAAEIELAFEAGAYPGSPVMQGATCAFACYDLDNATVSGYDVVVNKPKTAAYRAPGSPQAAFGVEQVVDELCQQLGVDPVEFRLNNASKEGVRKVEGPVFQRVGLGGVPGSRPQPRPLPDAAGRAEPGTWHRRRLLDESRIPLQCQHDGEPGRHGEPDRGFRGHRRFARVHRAAGRRDAGHRLR